MKEFRWKFCMSNESGQSLTEYLILMLLVAVVSIAGVKTMGSTIRTKIDSVRKAIHEDVDVQRN